LPVNYYLQHLRLEATGKIVVNLVTLMWDQLFTKMELKCAVDVIVECLLFHNQKIRTWVRPLGTRKTDSTRGDGVEFALDQVGTLIGNLGFIPKANHRRLTSIRSKQTGFLLITKALLTSTPLLLMVGLLCYLRSIRVTRIICVVFR
jgi:hypothetical protein